MLPFTLSFLDDVVPDNYRLPVTASVSGGDAAVPTIYRPLYKDWEIQKFVNSNRLDAFGKDGAEVVVTPQEEGGNPYLDDLTYVDFAFIVNKYTNDQCSLADLRDARSVTLTDTLPTYTDRNGVSRIAVLDADQNPGWTLSEDGKAVSRTYTGEHSAEILLQIYNDALHLRFPGLQFTALADGTLEADLDNTVHLEAIPSGEAPGETHPEADDPLRFRLTTDPTTQGKFAKSAETGDIYDVEVYKTNPYPWSLARSNGKSQPLRHIVIQDRTIVENGEVVLAGLDEALRFVRLESVTTGASLPEGKHTRISWTISPPITRTGRQKPSPPCRRTPTAILPWPLTRKKSATAMISSSRRIMRCRPAGRSASGPCRPPRSRNPTRSGAGCASRASA